MRSILETLCLSLSCQRKSPFGVYRKSKSTTMSQDTELLSGEPQAATKTILLVEDEAVISSLLVEVIVQETPYRAIVATDGRAALQLVQHFTPDLLLLDYRLPGMNGIELYDRLHSNEALAAIPAILMTASRQLPQEQL